MVVAIDLALLASLSAACAPDVDVKTMIALVRQESALDPLAININGPDGGRSVSSTSRAGAEQLLARLSSSGASVDAGLGQINSRNWAALGLTSQTVLDPCTNLAAAQAVLSDCYRRATARGLPAGQPALQAALSCYHTGDFRRGQENGYVSMVAARVLPPAPPAVPLVPALEPLVARDTPVMARRVGGQAGPPGSPLSPPLPRLPLRPGRPDRPDVFAEATPDAFSGAAP